MHVGHDFFCTTAAYLSPSLNEVLVVFRIHCDLHLHDIVLQRNCEMVMMNKLKEWGEIGGKERYAQS